MNNKITIEKKTLILRSEVAEIRADIKNTRSNEASLDFSSVEFINASFADELLNMVSSLSGEGITVKLLNLQGSVRKMISAIKKRKLNLERQLPAKEVD